MNALTFSANASAAKAFIIEEEGEILVFSIDKGFDIICEIIQSLVFFNFNLSANVI